MQYARYSTAFARRHARRDHFQPIISVGMSLPLRFLVLKTDFILTDHISSTKGTNIKGMMAPAAVRASKNCMLLNHFDLAAESVSKAVVREPGPFLLCFIAMIYLSSCISCTIR